MKPFIAIGLLLFIALIQEKDLPPAQAELVNTERAFAKLAVERGVRESFIAYFADDGIGFGPHPHKVKETLSKSPASATNSSITLNWAPVYGDISQAGDIGWNTGPTLIEDNSPEKKPARHGMFFSVWKKQSDGSWRVALDLGANTPAAVAPLDAPFKTSYRESGNAPKKKPVVSGNLEQEIAGLLKAEREFLTAAKTSSLGQAYQGRWSDDARVHRPGTMPVVGKDAINSWTAQQAMTLIGEPIKADVSRSGDLGYVYGSYELGGTQAQKGYFARVWKKDMGGQWRIEVDIINPLPPGTAQLAARSEDGLASKAEEHYLAQRWAEAAEAYLQFIKQKPDDPVAWHRLGTSQIYLKQLPEAIKSLEQAIKVGGGAALDFYNLACAFALSGQKEKALDSLEKAIGAGFTDRRQYESDSDLDSLRESDRFKDLLKRLR